MVLTEIGPVEIEVSRDRDGSFEPVIVPKRKRRLDGVDQIVLSLTARGLTTGEIVAHFDEVYGAKVSKDTISRITEKVTGELAKWASRPLDARRFLAIVANRLSWISSHELCGCLVSEDIPWSVVEFVDGITELLVGDRVQVEALREVLTQEPVRVLVAAALPG